MILIIKIACYAVGAYMMVLAGASWRQQQFGLSPKFIAVAGMAILAAPIFGM